MTEIEPTVGVYKRAARAWSMDINSRMTIPFPADAEPLSEFTAHRAEAAPFRAAVESSFAEGCAAERARIVAELRNVDNVLTQTGLKPGSGWEYAIQRIAAAFDRGDL